MFSDFVELSCLSFSNAVDRRQFDAREARYLQIAKRYPRDVFESFPRMLGHLTFAMEQRYAAGGLGDVLGVVYMQLELGNDRAGQFFTPYHVSQMMARMLVGDGAEVRAKGFLDVLEPASGAGGMVIAMADALQQAGLNYQGAMHATCIDIDLCCVHMTYLQASLLHIPAIVLHGNSLSNEVWSRWYTPAHVLGGWRPGLAMSGLLVALYGVLYGILVSEDNALMMGSLLLFGVLAAIMVATRQIDWYNVMGSDAPPEAVPPATARSEASGQSKPATAG